jgi:hypothetical protein
LTTITDRTNEQQDQQAMTNQDRIDTRTEKVKDNAAMWAAIGIMATAICGAAGVIAASYFGYMQVIFPAQLQATQTAEARQVPVIYMPTPRSVTPMPTSAIRDVTPIPTSAISNVVKYFDFEEEPQQSISLGVCDATAPAWWDACHDAPAKLIRAEQGFTGQYSLGIQAELLPEQEQVYSVRFLIDPLQVANALSAVVYVPDTDLVSRVSFAAWYEGGTGWFVSTLMVDRTGWSHIYLDMQQAATSSTISEIHIDWFLPRADRQSVESLVMIDDLRFYYPASALLESNP